MKHLLSLNDLTREEIIALIDYAIKIKNNPDAYNDALKNKTLSMIFQKESTRTRISFEAAMTQLGGHAIYLDWRTTNFVRASIADEIKCISRYSNAISARLNSHDDILAMANSATVPVINALTDKSHPCQILGDLMTIKEKFGNFNVKMAFIGDGNNVSNTLIAGCDKLGIKITVATPKGYEPAGKSPLLTLTNDPKKAAESADVIYTDTWISMGQEAENDKRIRDFKGYTITADMVRGKVFMHCLPAHRGLEVESEALDSPASIVFDQAENRMHIQKAILLELINNN
jgi:ornithine carbamoyltransferase